MAQDLDEIMQEASKALARMDYLTCESLCLRALAQARASGDWAYYARVLMPLQEARRQRRMIAAEGVIRLGTASLQTPSDGWIAQVQTGCIALTRPHTADDARRLHDAVRAGRQHAEVLLVDSPTDADMWRLRSFQGPEVACDFAAPPVGWRDRWLSTGDAPTAESGDQGIKAPATPADWFLDACEALGDAALATVPAGRRDDVEALEPLLNVAPDHEILHQTLANAARERARRGNGSAASA